MGSSTSITHTTPSQMIERKHIRSPHHQQKQQHYPTTPPHDEHLSQSLTFSPSSNRTNNQINSPTFSHHYTHRSNDDLTLSSNKHLKNTQNISHHIPHLQSYPVNIQTQQQHNGVEKSTSTPLSGKYNSHPHPHSPSTPLQNEKQEASQRVILPQIQSPKSTISNNLSPNSYNSKQQRTSNTNGNFTDMRVECNLIEKQDMPKIDGSACLTDNGSSSPLNSISSQQLESYTSIMSFTSPSQFDSVLIHHGNMNQLISTSSTCSSILSYEGSAGNITTDGGSSTSSTQSQCSPKNQSKSQISVNPSLAQTIPSIASPIQCEVRKRTHSVSKSSVMKSLDLDKSSDEFGIGKKQSKNILLGTIKGSGIDSLTRSFEEPLIKQESPIKSKKRSTSVNYRPKSPLSLFSLKGDDGMVVIDKQQQSVIPSRFNLQKQFMKSSGEDQKEKFDLRSSVTLDGCRDVFSMFSTKPQPLGNMNSSCSTNNNLTKSVNLGNDEIRIIVTPPPFIPDLSHLNITHCQLRMLSNEMSQRRKMARLNRRENSYGLTELRSMLSE